MTSPQGWYPDPNGVPGTLRYWDGKAWSDRVASDPRTPAATRADSGTTPPPPLGGSALPWVLLAIVTVIAVVAMVTTFVVRGRPAEVTPAPTSTVASPTDTCLQTGDESPSAHPTDGRVHGGDFTFPVLGSPWSDVQAFRIPFGHDTFGQSFVTEADYAPGADWTASVMVSSLVTGDGFTSPRVAAMQFYACVLKTRYGTAAIDTGPYASLPADWENADAWRIDSQVTFSIEGLKATKENMTIVVVSPREDPTSLSLFYSVIPDTAFQYSPQLDQTQSDLTFR